MASEGNDTVRSSLTYTLSANLENLTLLGAANLNGFGNAAVNILTGNTGGNFIQGFAGADTINGGDGNDWLDGGEGGDTINGGAGFDVAAFGSSPVAVNIDLQSGVYSGGEATGETLTNIEALSGSSFDDQIFGDANANALYGQGGFDFMQGRDGNDTLEGGAGGDWLDGGAGADTIIGGDGIHDTAAYGASIAAVSVDLASGVHSGGDATGDTLSGIEWLSGSAWNDNLFGSASINTLFGQGGADFMQGRGGDDTLEGGEGNDWLDGGTGSDIINGGNGSDTAAYGASVFSVNLDLQSGLYSGGEANGDTLISIENLSGSALADNLFGNASANTLHGQGGADFMQGRGGADTLNGGEGNDWLDGGAGADAINGGNGTDTAAFGASTSAVTLDLQAGTYSGGEATGDTLSSIENLSGSVHADTLLGNASANTLFGQGGGDVLNGRAGNDILHGGAGNDAFLFGAGDGDDTITDFVAGGVDDAISLSAYNGSGITWTVDQVGGNTVFNFSNGDSITLLNVTATNLIYDGMFGYS